MTGRRYFLLTLALCAAVLLPVVALNYALGNRSLGNAETTRLASAWQQATRGVTYSPPMNHNRAFKTLRLHDRAAEINAVVFGASSMFGIAADMFPADIRAYNFSQSGNSLADSLGEAGYVRKRFGDRIQWYFIALDWSIGFVFQPEKPHEMNLDPAVALAAMRTLDASFHRKLLDALSYPKIKNLVSVLRDIARAKEKGKAFRQVFLEVASEEYPCPDGSIAKDFDVLYRGKCGGFYYDGSTSFTAWRPIRAQDVDYRVLAASLPSSKYSQSLAATRGNPNPAYLDRVAQLSRDLKPAGAQVIVVLPPLIPGMEERLAAAPHSADSLRRLKEALAGWARSEDIVILDAGRSGLYGCRPLEFLDEHHAMRECYRKVFDRFWRDYRRGIAPGLYAVQ
jgi:hypothetical protein